MKEERKKITDRVSKGIPNRRTDMKSDGNIVEALITYMQNVPPGKVEDVRALERMLFQCWHELGGDAESLQGYKLLHRMEDVEWDPPEISFTIERHGATVMGSTRADLHRWTVDLEKGVAEYGKWGMRQVRAKQPRLDVNPIAHEIADLIVNHKDDNRLKWYEDGRVTVAIGKIIPDTGPKDTLSARRKRFRRALEERLKEHGWEEIRANVYARKEKATNE